MAEDVLKQGYITPDGQVFETKAAAQTHLRRPKILEAMNKLTGDNADLSEWLIDNHETVWAAFDTGTIRRVSKAEKKKLEKALEAIVENGDKKFAFIIENAGAIAETFRWPSVKRMTDEEKAVAAKNTLMAASDNNEDLANWAIENEKGILEAYDAGKEKRPVSPKATDALAAYRLGVAAKKEAKEAGKSDEEAAAIGKKVEEEARAASNL